MFYRNFSLTIGGKIPAVQYGSIDISVTVELELDTDDNAEFQSQLDDTPEVQP